MVAKRVRGTPWTAAQIAVVKDAFLASRTGLDAFSEISRHLGPQATKKAVLRMLGRGSKHALPVPPRVNSVAPSSTLQKMLIIPDCHVPYEDKKAFDLMIKVGLSLKPDLVVILGDFADYYSISKYTKNVNRILDFSTENRMVNKRLDDVDKIPAKRKIFLAGNHEQRLLTHLAETDPAMYNFTGIAEALRLEERGWEFYPYHEYVKVGKLFLTHDTEDGGSNAHQKAGATFAHSIAIGHVHSLHVSYFGNALGETHVCASLGWLGAHKYADYAKTIKKLKNWQLGFGWAAIEPGGNVHLQAVPIVEGRCYVEGKLFSCA